MKRKLILFLIVVFSVSYIEQANACTYVLPTTPYLSGTTLTSDNNIILSTIIDPNSQARPKVALNLNTKTVKLVTNETIFTPKADEHKYYLNYTYNLFNGTYTNVSLNVFYFNNTQIFNCPLEVIMVVNNSITLNTNGNWSLTSYLNNTYTNVFISKKYDRMYFENIWKEDINNPDVITSVSIQNPAINQYNITTEYYSTYLAFNSLEIFDDYSLLYALNSGYGSDCVGFRYFRYNESSIWQISGSTSYAVQTSVFNTNTGSFYQVWGVNNEVKIQGLDGSVSFDWIIGQQTINSFLNNSSSSFSSLNSSLNSTIATATGGFELFATLGLIFILIKRKTIR